jgi:alkaline phosphatase D
MLASRRGPGKARWLNHRILPWFLELFLLLAFAPAGRAADPPLLVTVGEVTHLSAVIWGRREGSGPLTLEYGRSPDRLVSSGEITVDATNDFTGKFRIDQLSPSTRYNYRLRGGGRENLRGEFVTAPAPDEPRAVSFLWSGDLGSTSHCRDRAHGYPIFATMTRVRPDFFLFVGDTIYADHRCSGPEKLPGYDFVATTLHDFRAKHRYNRADPAVQELFRSTSVYAIWDDHEVRNDFSGIAEPLTAVGRQAFLDYWPIQPPVEEPGRLYRGFRRGKLLELFILDTRQYRTPNREPDGATKTMLGPRQRRWLIERVSGSDAVWKVIVSSVPLSVPTGRAARDSWSNANVLGFPEENATGFAFERTLILKALSDRSVRNLVWLTADVHHAELIRHAPWDGFRFHEFIAGPLSAGQGRPRPLDSGLNPLSLLGVGGIENFGAVEVNGSGLKVRIIDVAGVVRGQLTLSPQ